MSPNRIHCHTLYGMSRYEYFDELSADGNSDGDVSCSDLDDDVGNDSDDYERANDGKKVSDKGNEEGCLHDRIILHADVDCFYCNCEVIDRKLDPARPLAIGQKHIIVTCNYAARAMGITKLMDRKTAQEIGGSTLFIVDGSDLQRYRIHGRKIYETFRRNIKCMHPESLVRKGCMDEMMADISSLQVPSVVVGTDDLIVTAQDVFVYNDSNNEKSSVITLVEDQTGESTTIVNRNNENNSHFLPGVEFQKKLCNAASVALKVRQSVLNETGFSITIGLSYNPMMAKIGSGLRKPGKVNVLSPSPISQQLIQSMPLRKIPGIGSRTMKALVPCLEQRHGIKGGNDLPWICRYAMILFSSRTYKAV
jgi:DNA polymerase iota